MAASAVSAELQPKVSGQADLAAMLADALNGDPAAAGLDVYYQPIVRLEDAEAVAVEALARWKHPSAGTIDPQVFVSIAERAGLTDALDDFVLDRACADADVLAGTYGRLLDLHVNVSGGRLGGDDLESAVAEAVGKHGLWPGRLTLEITETSRIPDMRAAAAAVRRIRENGVRVALDDFGSGFNSLRELHALSVDTIKLDASLIDMQPEPERAAALCRSVLTICRDLDLTVIAEGVETLWQAELLIQLGCRFGQGYLFGSPEPVHGLRMNNARC